MSHSSRSRNEPGNVGSRRERGTVTILIVMSMIGLLAMTALAVDGAFVFTTRTQLQHVADSGALAGIGAIRDGLSTAEALAEAKVVVEDPQHRAGGKNVQVTSGLDLVRGTYDLGTRTFTPGTNGNGVTAVRSIVRRSEGSPAGPLELLLGRVVGVDEVDVAASAVAAVRRRDVVIVQDRTNSFKQEFSDAIRADLALVEAMTGGQALAGDRIGVASFNRYATEDLDLTPVDTGKNQIINAIEDLVVCDNQPGQPWAPGCGGTGTADALDAALNIFERGADQEDAEKVLVLVTDGVPCHGEEGFAPIGSPPEAAAVAIGKELALEAAERVRAAGINLYAVTLAVPATSGACLIPQPEFAETLVSGFGYAVSTPDEDDLDDLLVSIVQQMPVRLVE